MRQADEWACDRAWGISDRRAAQISPS
jgi:hypothetical protein